MGFVTTCPNRSSWSLSHAVSAYRTWPVDEVDFAPGVRRRRRRAEQVGADRVGASRDAGRCPSRRHPVDARPAAAAGPSSAGFGASGGRRGTALDPERRQCAAADGAVRSRRRRAVQRGRPAGAGSGARSAAPDRRHPHPRRQSRATLGDRWRHQAARRVRSDRQPDHLLCRHLVADQRRDRRQVVSDRARRPLRVRQGLLLLHVLGEPGRRWLPVRHPAQDQHAGADHPHPPRAQERTPHPERCDRVSAPARAARTRSISRSGW
jgi:hypothetical protein